MVRRISSGCSGLDQRVVVHQRRLVGAHLPLLVARRAVPGARHHALVAGDLAVLDLHPVAQRAARRVEIAEALRASPARWTAPTSSPLKVWVSPLLIRSTSWSYQLSIRRASSTVSMPAGRGPAQRGEQRRRPDLEPVQRPPSPSPGSPRGPRRRPTSIRASGPTCIGCAVVPRRLHPGVLVIALQVVHGGGGPVYFGLGLALVGVEPRVVAARSTRTRSW